MYSVAYDKINGLIASGSKDKTIRLWHPTVYEPAATPTCLSSHAKTPMLILSLMAGRGARPH